MIGNFNNPSWDGSIPDEKHIVDALRKLGHKVYEIQRECTPIGVPLTKQLKPEKFDFILIAQWNGYAQHICNNLKEWYNCPVIYWAFDYQFKNQEDWHFEMAKEADIFLSPEYEHKEFYKSLGCNFYWFPQAFAPEFLDKYPQPVNKEYDVVFTGSYTPFGKLRTDILKAVDQKFDLHIFGVTGHQWQEQGLKNIHPAVMDEGLPELYAKSKIILSIPLEQVEGSWCDRNAQAMACGSFVLFKYVTPAEQIFKDTIGYFNTTEDCFKKIDYYLKNADERELIAYRGYKYAQNYLKTKGRIKELLILLENAL